MINYREAQQILVARARSFGRERVGLEQAYGRVLTERIRADRDYPPFNRSTMDGYAIRYSDWESGIRDFSITEVIYAGALPAKTIGPGECYKIMTGAAVPQGADAVIRKEEVEEDARWIHTGQAVCLPFQNIASRGEDLQSGDTVIQAACLCDPSVMGLLASVGKEQVEVEKLPAVSLFTTGNEIVPFDAPASLLQIRNSNRWVLESLFAGGGGIRPRSFAHLPDDRRLLHSSLEAALGSDLIVLSGGVSAGDADFVPGVLEEIGVRKLFHKVAIKPGKPVWCGILPNGGMVFALPGNPFSCLVTFRLFIQSYLNACFGLSGPIRFELPLQAAKIKKTVLDEFFPVRITGDPAWLDQVPLNGSGDIRLGLRANALGLHPAAAGGLEAGDRVICLPYQV